MANVAQVFTEILMPILFMVSLGALVHRASRLDMKTLVRINLYLFVPAFLFYRLLESQQSWLQIGKSGLAITVPILLLGIGILVVMRACGASFPATISDGHGGQCVLQRWATSASRLPNWRLEPRGAASKPSS